MKYAGEEILHHVDDLRKPFGPTRQKLADLFCVFFVSNTGNDFVKTGNLFVTAAAVAAATAQKKVKEAEAEAQAAEYNKKAAIAKAEGEAEAQKIEADAVAYKNQKIAQNLSIMQAQWKHEEEMKRLEKWNGVQVSTQSVYVPNTYDLKSGK